MSHRILHALKTVANRSMAPLGIELANKRTHDWSDVRNFIPFESTIASAKKTGLAVGDYIDNVMNKTPGATQDAIDRLSKFGVFSGEIQTVVEIGPGSGRYLEKTLRACKPIRYEIYETARDWARYVTERYGVLVQPTDGQSLKATANDSADLVQAHKVFSSTTFMITSRYWVEIVRVTKPGGHVAFDLMTEACLGSEMLEARGASGFNNGSYPSVMPRQVALNYFQERGFLYLGGFFEPMPPGKTEMFVFRKLGDKVG